MNLDRILKRARPLLVAVAVAAVVASATTVIVLACGPFLRDLETVRTLHPAQIEQFEKGEMGVVRPRFARRYLVHAYRSFSGRPPLVLGAAAPRPNRDAIVLDAPSTAFEQWIAERDSVLGPNPANAERDSAFNQFRYVGDNYQSILNCPDDAFFTAIKALEARRTRYGPSSADLRDWTKAQAVVFSNCPGPSQAGATTRPPDSPPLLPDPAPPAASPAARADRAYQMAAAYFYGLDYTEAARRFREVAADQASPWRPYGFYLAARSMIRMATVKAANETERDRFLTIAQDELKRVLADPGAASLHESSRGLIDFSDARLRTVDRLHAVTRTLTTASSAREQDLQDFQWLMDQLIGDTVDYQYGSVRLRDQAIANDDLTDWVLAIQGQGDGASQRSLARWRATHSPLWLVAAMWNADASGPGTAELIDAARAIDLSSPAYPTISFLRVRLLAAARRRDEARALLATLPNNPAPGFAAETINLLKAQRFMMADNLGELLNQAARTTTNGYVSSVREPDGRTRFEIKPYTQPVFDSDAGAVFSRRLPLDRLVEAATSNTLPPRLRLRVTMAAFTRAILLRRDDAGLRVAPVLRQLAPQIATDLDRYVKAPNADDRHLAAILLLMRTPGLHADVRGADDEDSVDDVEPEREFRHLGGNWWCGFDGPGFNANSWQGVSEVIHLLYPTKEVPYPSFVTNAERAATERELKTLATVGAARSYLAAEVLVWARARPKDPNVPEALALVVEGWRWSCGESDNWQLSQRAFQTLRQQYPTSEWAQRTKYWYK